MSAPAHIQRNAYEGMPARACMVLRMTTPSGDVRDFKLVVDTACPVSFILGPDEVAEFSFGVAAPVNTNFGMLQGEWFLLAMPELKLDALMVGYASEQAAYAVRLDHSEFAGIAGLPLLRLLEYGGNHSEFWIRRLP
jgi:hypothetical protein